ncbi:hypothetical protein ATANTOWER_007633 [Ataeniobius toweri]|uniref:Uncharacterized protein n=1 Tax=Ataeniobius toweri TaxID=208326 RepID=A0ABU7CHA0_9TELE|nr:hypothetical protein [Ataeniobius toweri]
MNTSLNLPLPSTAQDLQDLSTRSLIASPALPVQLPTPSTAQRNPLTRHIGLSASVSVACSLLPRTITFVHKTTAGIHKPSPGGDLSKHPDHPESSHIDDN